MFVGSMGKHIFLRWPHVGACDDSSTLFFETVFRKCCIWAAIKIKSHYCIIFFSLNHEYGTTYQGIQNSFIALPGSRNNFAMFQHLWCSSSIWCFSTTFQIVARFVDKFNQFRIKIVLKNGNFCSAQ